MPLDAKACSLPCLGLALCAALVLPRPGLAQGLEAADVQAAIEIIEQNHGAQLDEAALYRAAIEGMLRELNAQQGQAGNRLVVHDEAFEDAQGNVKRGVGVDVQTLPGHGLLVMEVYPGSPAEEAGIRSGESIVALNGQPLSRLPPDRVFELMKSCRSQPVTMDILGKDGTTRSLTPRPASFQIEPVTVVQTSPTQVVRVRSFNQGAAKALARALKQLDPDQAVVLDLRDTGTGLVEEALAAADLFLPPGSVVGEELHRDGSSHPLLTTSEITHRGAVAVLVNQGTASSAELFSGALQEQARAMLVGVPTAGISRIPARFELKGGVELELAATELRSPRGSTWGATGLRPDLLVSSFDAVMLQPTAAPPDLQMEAALQIVQVTGP